MINQIMIEGRLTADPKQVKNAVLFTLAHNRRFKVEEQWKEETVFIQVITHENEKIAAMKKGMRVLVLGRLSSSSYEKDGERKTTIEIVADDIRLLSEFEKQTEQKAEQKVDKSEQKVEQKFTSYQKGKPTW